ncbi:peptidyl-prolyl cis-trans isomerase [Ensifer aridi]|uniref:peptidylprolyl isomerase n=1 Tax=Ensifer aridi TaxID=1708715 RepID=UPI000A10C334|nr:peptidylprolyl isomerase [Ensifer aridi]
MKLLREPLFHFAIGGLALFAAYAWLNDDTAASDRPEIRISDGHLRWVSETWSSQWRRTPSNDELRGLVAELVKEELLAREARALGLDQDDTVIRRRLAQKLTFLIEDAARIAEPKEGDLRQFYNAHPNMFRQEARVSFDHVFFSGSKRPDAAADARRVLAASDGPDETAIINQGDQWLAAARLEAGKESDIAAQFGPAFARAVAALPTGEWMGPIESAYGQHLVRVSEVVPAAVRPFAEVKAEVLAQWRDEQRRNYERRYLAELLKKYEIVAEPSAEPLISGWAQTMVGVR